MDFWLISVPLDKTTVTSLEKLKHTVAKTNLASCCKFSIPELKVGTLDNLLSMSDDLSRLDTLTESVIKRTCQCMGEVMEQPCGKVLENTVANGDPSSVQEGSLSTLKAQLKALRVDLVRYVTKFQWDRAKYPTTLPLRTLVESINKQVSQVEAELKSRTAVYNSLKNSLQGLEGKAEGSLQTRSLNDVVKRGDLVDSEYLTTLLVVVTRGSYKQWENTYESLAPFVVPRSSRKLYDDGEGGIFSVTLFKRAVDEFTARAKQSRFTVRSYNLCAEEQQRQEMQQLSTDKREQHGAFVRWLKVNFSELFIALIHLKATRVFVESVLRYGLPVSYEAFLLQPDTKRANKLRELLASLFKHLDPTAMCSKIDQGYDIPEMSQQEYFSYIFFQISTNLLESRK